MTFVAEEIESQPDLWRRAAALAVEQAAMLPEPGARIALFGCGTSLYVAQAIAAAREAAGHGETDAFAASEMPLGRQYDSAVALSRSGTTTEVLELTRRLRESTPVLAVTAQPDSPLAELAT
ncbi:MAG: SIS domain-containing protein, partial [Solirubrobacterales bacterium]|nr:SIS domain-containing protein [Solirubrobacterales bacterium]